MTKAQIESKYGALQASELRIGNIVYQGERYGDDAINSYQLCQFDVFQRGGTVSEYYKEWKPTPLTEEWLTRFGAKHTVDLYWLPVANLKCELHFEFYEEEIVTTLKGSFCELILDPLEYVHQFQNLFFALTGEELTVTNLSKNATDK